MAQPFSYRYPLVDGHGNFGSVDGDGAAAMRYTEARMSKISLEMLTDINKNTVDFVDNYDATELEPAVLPSRLPHLLINGATGIAVGMATNIPPHNLTETINATLAYMDDNDITLDGLMEHIKGPDFPTGGIIMGYSGLRQAYETGSGTIVIRSKAEIVEGKNGKNSIIVTEIPYMVNKTRLIERIAEIVKDKIVDGITDLRDESSDRNGMRIVIELRKDVNPNVMLNNLFKYTQLQTSYGINTIALVGGKPERLSLKDCIKYYVIHQFEVITRRTQFDLDKTNARLHILEGLIKAQSNIDEVVHIIRNTKDGTEKQKLMDRFELDDIQAQSILDMQLRAISGLNIEKTQAEFDDKVKLAAELKSILESEEKKHDIIKNELIEIRDKYKSQRVSEIDLTAMLDIDNESLIPEEDVIITITNKGYAKRQKVVDFQTQNRGGTGQTGIKTNNDDYVVHSILTSTHDYLLAFTNKGRVYKIKGYEIPEMSRQSKGLPIVNLLSFDEGEKLAAISNIRNFDDENSFFIFVTKKGIIKRTPVSEYKNIRQSGIIALGLKEDDELFAVRLSNGNQEVILGASNGKAIKFNENDVRSMGRTASGVKGMDLADDEEIVGASLIYDNENDEILAITAKGYGKRSLVTEYRTQSRGGKGVKTVNVTEKNGNLKTLMTVNDECDLIITTNKGVVIRISATQISQTGRNTQGVKLIRLREDQFVSTITYVPHQEEDKENDEVIEVAE